MADLLLVASGISAWLAVYNLVVYAIRRQRLSLWVGLWSTVSFVYQLARHMQLGRGADTSLSLIDSVCFASAVCLIPLIVLAIQELTQSRRFPRAGLAFAALAVVVLPLHAATDLFIGSTFDTYTNFHGAQVAFTKVGPLYAPLLMPLSLTAFVFGVLMVIQTNTLSRREKVVWLGAMGTYQLVGGNDLMLFSGLTRWLAPNVPGQSLFEFGVVGMAVALSLRTARRAEFSQQQLESLVHQRTQQLEDALTEARAAVESKAAFLASMSHEVRTPLNGIIGLTELLLDETLPEPVKERLSLVLRSGHTLKGLVDDVLDFAKLDAKGLTLSNAPFEPALVLEDVVALFAGNAQARGLSLARDAHDLPTLVMGDQQRVRQVLSNLVSNAVKFTERGSVRVAARAERTGDRAAVLHFDVIDTGSGISTEDQAKLFRPFSQVGVGISAPGQGGTGLGLAICRELARLMGGDVSLASEPGRGSTFTLWLPVEVRAWRAATSKTDLPKVTNRYHARVLVAEDNPINRLVTDGLLRSLGLEPTMVNDGLQAVTAANGGAFALIFMDCQMPELDGFEATRRLRKGGYERPIIALTAYASDEDRQRCLASGMTDYLTKPLRKQELDVVLARYLS
jgi:signal transduction histidine kinase/CheY-like chemotaxis protein